MPRDEFVDLCLELLSPLGAVRSRRMFGGHGLYVDDLFIAIVASGRLYVKADATTTARFSDAGCEPFAYSAKGKAVTLNYWAPPAEAMESPALMAPWARLGVQAALSARHARQTVRTRTDGRGLAAARAARAPRRKGASSSR